MDKKVVQFCGASTEGHNDILPYSQTKGEKVTTVLWETITNAMPKSPDKAIHGFWFDENEQEIICMGSKDDREKAANFLEAILQVPILTGDYAELDGTEGSGHYITID